MSGAAVLGQIRSSWSSSTGAATVLGNQLRAASARSHLTWGRQDLADLKDRRSKLAERD